jgi:hypothetical protein
MEGGYLALLTLPLSVRACLAPSQLSSAVKALIIALAFLAGFFLSPSSGEMNFGPFDRWIAEGISGAILTSLFAVFLLSLMGPGDRPQSKLQEPAPSFFSFWCCPSAGRLSAIFCLLCPSTICSWRAGLTLGDGSRS